jgi:hypothetical protein
MAIENMIKEEIDPEIEVIAGAFLFIVFIEIYCSSTLVKAMRFQRKTLVCFR